MKNLLKVKNIIFAVIAVFLTSFLNPIIKIGFWLKIRELPPPGWPSDPGRIHRMYASDNRRV